MHTCLIIGLGALAIGATIGRFLSSREKFFDGLAAIGAGTLAGLIVGLSESPILATGVTGAIGLASTVAPLLLKPSNDERDVAFVHLRPYVGPFAVFAAVGILLGITLRVNDALNLKDPSIRARLEVLGFSDVEVDQMIERYAADPSANELVSREISQITEASPGTSLLSNRETQAGWAKIWETANPASYPNVDDRLGYVMRQSPDLSRERVYKLVANLCARGESKENILTHLNSQFSGVEP